MRFQIALFLTCALSLSWSAAADPQDKRPARDAHHVLPVVDFRESEVLHRAPPSVRKTDESVTQKKLETATVARLEETFDDCLEKSKVTGASAAILIEGEGIWRSARGVADKVTGAPMTTASRFHAASIGKMFTAALLLKQMEKGQLELSDTIDRWFPDFPNGANISLDHLLTHTSGIYSFNWSSEVQQATDYISTDQLLNIAKMHGPMFPPGEKWSYSNTNYLMLGLVVSEVCGEPYEMVLAEFLQECGLSNGAVVLPDNAKEVLVAGYHQGSDARDQMNHALPQGAGLVACDPGDLVIFMHRLLAGKVLSQESVQLMLADLYPMGSEIGHWGRGLMTLRMPMGEVVYLTGRIKGYGSAVAYWPEKNAVIAVMVNDQTPVDPFIYRLLTSLQ